MKRTIGTDPAAGVKKSPRVGRTRRDNISEVIKQQEKHNTKVAKKSSPRVKKLTAKQTALLRAMFHIPQVLLLSYTPTGVTARKRAVFLADADCYPTPKPGFLFAMPKPHEWAKLPPAGAAINYTLFD
jgi:hypothetical protein